LEGNGGKLTISGKGKGKDKIISEKKLFQSKKRMLGSQEREGNMKRHSKTRTPKTNNWKKKK